MYFCNAYGTLSDDVFVVVELYRRRSRELKEREKEQVASEPEADPERDQRTVFAYQVNVVNLFLT